MNLLKETIDTLKENGRTEKDILFIGSKEIRITLDNFKEVADIEYDSGFGAAEVAQDLMIIGKDFWMVRGEYDGSEWWNFLSMPDIPNVKIKHIKKLVGGMWDSISELNKKKSK